MKVGVKGICGSTVLIYVMNSVQVPQQGSLLPIQIHGKKIVWDQDRDGESVGAKVGGSFYSCSQMTLQDFWIGHIPSFNGSIGFRCSSDLLE